MRFDKEQEAVVHCFVYAMFVVAIDIIKKLQFQMMKTLKIHLIHKLGLHDFGRGFCHSVIVRVAFHTEGMAYVEGVQQLMIFKFTPLSV